LDVSPAHASVSPLAATQIDFDNHKQQAKQLKRWITHQLLPSIRKTARNYSFAESAPENRGIEQKMYFLRQMSLSAKF